MKSKIQNPKRMKQLIDFSGLELDGGIYPTDIDGLIEYHNSEYIIIEVKHGNANVPYGQRLALRRMVDDFTKAGKKQWLLFASIGWTTLTSQLLQLVVRSERFIMVVSISGDRLTIR